MLEVWLETLRQTPRRRRGPRLESTTEWDQALYGAMEYYGRQPENPRRMALLRSVIELYHQEA